VYGDDGPDDDYMTTEQAVDNGWMMPDDVDLLKALVKHLEDHPDPNHPHNAALLLIRWTLEPMPEIEGSDQAVKLAWARTKLPLGD
jgi:hypothetical protein